MRSSARIIQSAVAVAIAAGVWAGQAYAADRPSFSTNPEQAPLTPAFAWGSRDYAVRCDGHRLGVHVDGASGWSSQVGDGEVRTGSFDASTRLAYDQSLTISFRRDASANPDAFHVRCLPPDFPSYDFQRFHPGGVRLFGIQIDPYAVIFDSDGAPIWWFDTGEQPNDVEVLPDRTIAWSPVIPRTNVPKRDDVRSLDGRLVRHVSAVNGRTDSHELILLRNGNYLLGGRVNEKHVDTTRFGGPADATVTNAVIQEVTPAGKLVWKWDSADHIRLGETPQRWWDQLHPSSHGPIDLVHWNAAEVAGKHMLLSFRHLDAVYEINRRTGRIVWKLGGTHTAKSLAVIGDPEGSYPLGGQHDVRLLPDGTISIHDNNSFLGRPPRVVRYRVNARTGTATLVQTITDPAITDSSCCGSARMTGFGNWLIDWGASPQTTAYDSQGVPLYTLTVGTRWSYRAIPVPPGLVTPAQLRRGMDRMER